MPESPYGFLIDMFDDGEIIHHDPDYKALNPDEASEIHTLRAFSIADEAKAERRKVVQEAIAARVRELEPIATSHTVTEVALDVLGL